MSEVVEEIKEDEANLDKPSEKIKGKAIAKEDVEAASSLELLKETPVESQTTCPLCDKGAKKIPEKWVQCDEYEVCCNGCEMSFMLQTISWISFCHPL
ncbi:hypothetical protein LIER_38234 [Lithospermum erythrorhizon]|uniref:Uncharacterized protein n=1 Tax=Lithospermum erythrorhizon TaxID=34254 RepID=A0AAV3Q157_LITER